MIPIRIIRRARSGSGSSATAAAAPDRSPEMEQMRAQLSLLAAECTALAGRVAELESMWLRDPGNPAVIYTPGSAYAVGTLACLESETAETSATE